MVYNLTTKNSLDTKPLCLGCIVPQYIQAQTNIIHTPAAQGQVADKEKGIITNSRCHSCSTT